MSVSVTSAGRNAAHYRLTHTRSIRTYINCSVVILTVLLFCVKIHEQTMSVSATSAGRNAAHYRLTDTRIIYGHFQIKCKFEATRY